MIEIDSKHVPKPIAISETPIVLEQITPTRVTRGAPVKTSSAVGPTSLQFSSRSVRLGPSVSPAFVRGVRADVDVPEVVTAADLPVSDDPDALAYSAPVGGGDGGGGGVGGGPALGRGFVGGAGFLVLDHVISYLCLVLLIRLV